MRCRSLIVVAFGVVASAWPVAAAAQWEAAEFGFGYSVATTMPAGSQPDAEASGRSAIVSWQQSGNTKPVDGYVVKRYDDGGQQQPVGDACAGLITGLSCSEDALAPGEWTYSVTPVNANWRGAESVPSSAVSIAQPSLGLDAAGVGALPATVTGQIASFIAGEQVEFRLDDPETGQLLSGQVSPGTVPANGAADVELTVPVGVAAGSHSIYAIGARGDLASTELTASAPVTVSASAWGLRDASSGTVSDNSDPSAFAGDGLTLDSGRLAKTFDADHHVDFAFNSPLAASLASSSLSFDLDFAPSRNASTACVYFEVYAGTALIGTHGSSSSPLACKTGNASFQTTSTPLPEVTNSTIADELEVKVYGMDSHQGTIAIDMATVSGTLGTSQPFTLYEKATTTASSSPLTAPWSLAAGEDEADYTSAQRWDSAFDGSRYLELIFPAYVPSGATVVGASLSQAYSSAKKNSTTCYYLAIYSGTSLIGTHGSGASPLSCNDSDTSWVTDEVPLEEVTTPAQANDLRVRLYVSNSKSQQSRHDLATLQLTYIP